VNVIEPVIKPTSNLPQTATPGAAHCLGALDVPPEAAIWNHLPAQCVFLRWVQQLQRAVVESSRPPQQAGAGADVLAQSDSPAAVNVWDLVGHGVVIEHADPEEAASLLPLAAQAAGLDYWEVASHEVVSSFSDWKQLLSERTPTLVHLRAGHWLTDDRPDLDELGLPSHPDDNAEAARRLRANLAQAMERRLSGVPVVVVVAVKDSAHLASELLGARRFERCVALPELDDATHGRIFMAQAAGLQFDNELVRQPEKVGVVVRRHGLRRHLDFAQALRRLVWQEGRPATLRDLIECDVLGTGEEDLGAVSSEVKWSVAVHEAGHALVAYLASNRQHVPAYCCIGSRRESAGLVMPSYDMIQRSVRGEDTYADMLLRLRVQLAGRCAEHVVLGAEQVSAVGAGSDLRGATRLAMRMVCALGLPPTVRDESDLASNLLVVIGHAADCEVDQYGSKARLLLREQYLHVLDLLRANLYLLLKLAKRLTMQGVLLQDELRQIMDGAPRDWLIQTDAAQAVLEAA
jgi:Peptidase family M41